MLRTKEILSCMLPKGAARLLKRIHYGRVFRSFREEEEPDLKAVRHLVRPNDHVVDIGANIGIYTKYLSDYVGPGGRVHSVEPVPQTFAILQSNVRKLGLSNVSLINCAISDAAGMVTMNVPQNGFGGENLYGARVLSGDNSGGLTLPATTIDKLFVSSSEPIRFIKCDVEGHELQCVMGGLLTIDRWKPAWLIESSGNPDDVRSQAHEVLLTFSQRGYEAFWFDGEKLRLRRPGEKSLNYFLLTRAHLAILCEVGFRPAI